MTGLSLRWYHQLFANDQIMSAFGNTLVLALTSSLIALVIGCLIGYGMYRHRHRKLGWLIVLIYLPIVLPDIVFGISEMAFFVQFHRLTGLLQPGLGTMIIAHVTFQIPFVALIVYSRFVGLDPTLFEAAKDLYATPAKRVIHFMRTLGVPNGLAAVGYTTDDIPALVQGTLPQHRVTKLSPRPAGEAELTSLFEES